MQTESWSMTFKRTLPKRSRNTYSKARTSSMPWGGFYAEQLYKDSMQLKGGLNKLQLSLSCFPVRLVGNLPFWISRHLSNFGNTIANLKSFSSEIAYTVICFYPECQARACGARTHAWIVRIWSRCLTLAICFKIAVPNWLPREFFLILNGIEEKQQQVNPVVKRHLHVLMKYLKAVD